MTNSSQKLSVIETAGYSCGGAAANFVFMTMVLFQLNFYTDTFGLSAATAAAILLWPRLAYEHHCVLVPLLSLAAEHLHARTQPIGHRHFET